MQKRQHKEEQKRGEAQKKQQMAFELSEFDHKLIKFGKLFRKRFMEFQVSMPFQEALDLCWTTLAECFEPQELLMKEELINKYFPKDVSTADEPGSTEG